VTIIYRGKVKGRLMPVSDKTGKKAREHHFFGMQKGKKESVSEELSGLRRPTWQGLFPTILLHFLHPWRSDAGGTITGK